VCVCAGLGSLPTARLYRTAIDDYEEKTRFRKAKQQELKESCDKLNKLTRANKELRKHALANYTGARMEQAIAEHKAAAAVIALDKGPNQSVRAEYEDCERHQYEAGLLCLKVTHTPILHPCTKTPLY